MTPDEIVSGMRAATRINSSSSREGATLMTITVSARSGTIAAGVLNEYLTIIQQEDVERRTVTAGQTLDFYDQEMDRLSALLDDKSSAILGFQNANADALPDSLNARLSQQSTLQDRLLQTERDLSTLERQREQVVRLFEATGTVSSAGGQDVTRAEADLAALRVERRQALAIYSANNPRVRLLDSRIAQAEAAVAAEAEAIAAGRAAAPDAADGAEADPASAQRQGLLEIQLSELDARADALRQQKAEIEDRLAEIETVLERIPANRITLEGLQRDYANVQAQYNAVVERRSQAATGERIESLSRGQRIAVIEPPSVPSGPTGPNRTRIAGGGTAAGLAAGLALVILLELLNQAPKRPRDLTARLGVTPFATIPFVPTTAQTVRRRGLKIAVILIGLLGVPAGLYAVHEYYRPLDLLVLDVARRAGL